MCDHLKIARNPQGFWICESCDQGFLPSYVVERMEGQQDQMVDLVTGMFSAMLWDLHERARETGQIPADEKPPETDEVCENLGGHNYADDGKCIRCGISPFLG